jgi:glycosyltransferase involved in cell wall biosynthesis
MTIRILFTNYVDLDNFNAQSLNGREIALRLNPQLFQSTLFYERIPDPRLLNRASIRLVKIPRRLGTLKILSEFFRGQDIIFRANLIRFSYLYLLMPNFLRRGAKIVEWFEAPTHEYLVWEPRYLELVYKWVIARVVDRVAMTEYVAEANLKHYGFKADADLIPVGVDTRLFVPPPRRQNQVPVVLFVGTLIERKNPHLVLLAARLFPRAKFVLVGAKRGKFYLILQQLAEKWDLENVTFYGPMPHRQLVTLMQKCDIFFHSSVAESIGKVVLEAGATGMPALIFDSFRSPAVLDGVTGFQVKNQEQMLDRLNLLLEDQEIRQRMGDAAIDYVKNFDWDLITKKWEKKFLELMKEKCTR